MDEDTYMKSVFTWKIHTYILEWTQWTHKHLHRTSQWAMQRTKAHQPGVLAHDSSGKWVALGWDFGSKTCFFYPGGGCYWATGWWGWLVDPNDISMIFGTCWNIRGGYATMPLCRGWSPESKKIDSKSWATGIYPETWLDPIFWKKHQQLRNLRLPVCFNLAEHQLWLVPPCVQMWHQLWRCQNI